MSDTRRPRIGITTYREPAAWGAWQDQADLLAVEYADALRRAGGAVLLLPPGAAEAAAEAQSVLGGLHGLVLAGGADVDPARYGQHPHPATDTPRTDRDQWELALVRAALDEQMPLLGVCRGVQVLNVALGGTLYQHLPDVVGSTVHCPSVGHFSRHRVGTLDDSRLASIIGPGGDVPTHHHQGLNRIAPELEPTAWADDGIVEAVEFGDGRWVIGVQWHPEVGGGEALFGAFVAAAAEYRDGERIFLHPRSPRTVRGSKTQG